MSYSNLNEKQNTSNNKQSNKTEVLFLIVFSVIVIITIGFFLFSNITWFKENVFNPENEFKSTEFLFIYQLFISTVKKSVALFTSFCLVFLGTGVLLYTAAKQDKIDFSGKGITFSLITNSPGIIAITIGVILMIVIILSPEEKFLRNLNDTFSATENSQSLQNPEDKPLDRTVDALK